MTANKSSARQPSLSEFNMNSLFCCKDVIERILQEFATAFPNYKRKELPSSSSKYVVQRKPRKPKHFRQKKFPPHLAGPDVKDGLKKGELIKGIIRINSKNSYKAYVANENCSQEDYLIQSLTDINRALEGDIVAIKLKSEEEWSRNKKTAAVVHILERTHSRCTVGFLQPMPDKNKHFALLISRDSRFPKIRIPASDCPSDFIDFPEKYENVLFKAKINSWNDMRYAVGSIIEKIGAIGDLEAETTALLIENDLDVTPCTLSEELLQSCSVNSDIVPLELLSREDLRGECVFTIESTIGQTLETAISCKKLSNGNMEIGVHVADISYYLKEGTPLDRFLRKRGRTIDLGNEIIHMLPIELRQQCSLIPGLDKYTLSVFWEVKSTGDIISHRFTHTIVNSCVHLMHHHIVAIIVNSNNEIDDFPMISNYFTYNDLSKSIANLYAVAVNLRIRRLEKGALDINGINLNFKFSTETGQLIEFVAKEKSEADTLLEEFMLLTNIYVAHKIYNHFPNLALLCVQDNPNQRLLMEINKTLEAFDIELDMSSSKALQECILSIQNKKNFGVAEMAALQYIIKKLIPSPYYVCSDNKNNFSYYAQNVPFLTTFTSPFTRYADIMVHRLLAASLGCSKKCYWKRKHLMAIVNMCNQKECNAQLAAQANNKLHLANYVEQHGPLIVDGVVVDVQEKCFDILIVEMGIVIRMHLSTFDDDARCIVEQSGIQREVRISYPKLSENAEETCEIQLFSQLKVTVYRKLKTNTLEAKLL